MTDDAVTPYLLLQARDDSDPIKPTEVECFLRVGEFNPADLETRSLFDPVDSLDSLVARKAVFVGGSGDYSIVRGGPWLDNALQWMATLAKIGRPTFASCFGFQAMALALGGSVVTDLSRAELGTIDLRCTDEGRLDPLFAPLPEVFGGQAGHQDIVERIPDCAVLFTRLAYAHEGLREADVKELLRLLKRQLRVERGAVPQRRSSGASGSTRRTLRSTATPTVASCATTSRDTARPSQEATTRTRAERGC